MSVYYYRGAQILAPFTIFSNEPMYDVDTVSLRKQRASQDVQRWELSFDTIGETDTQVEIFLAAIVDVDQVATMIMPQLPSVAEINTVDSNSPYIGINAAADVNQVVMQPVGVTGILPKGTFFKFSNGPKMYVTKQACNFDDTVPTLHFFPRLTKAVTTANQIMLKENAVFSYFTSIDNQTGITFNDGVLSNAGTITVIEAI